MGVPNPGNSPVEQVQSGEWLIGLEGWVIPDGNYDDFAVGQKRHFAEQLWSMEGLSASRDRTKRAVLRPDRRYELNGHVVYRSRAVSVIDFGLLGYVDENVKIDPDADSIAGTVYLGVDPFFYADDFAKQLGVPAAIYSWAVKEIWAETGPMISVRRGLLRRVAYVQRDPRRLSWLPVNSTSDGPGDGTWGSFILRCQLENQAPTYGPKV
ncbi:MAG: hypothetical protein ABI725_06665 [Chloroflexota bacterium]